jgi:hypothetical protein
MRRVMRGIVAAVIVLGTFVMSTAGAMTEELPIPPLPPDNPPPGDIAPVPNVDARAPIEPYSTSPTVDIRLFRARPYEPGMGFAPGSRYQTSEDRKPIQTPGLGIRVPLQ